MSYILDALKKADSQRDRAAVPGIGTQQVAVPAQDAPRAGRPLLWVTVAGIAAIAAAAAWRLMMAPPPPAPVIVVQAPAPAPAPAVLPVPAPAPSPAVQPVPAPAQPSSRATRTPAASKPLQKASEKAAPAARLLSLNELPAELRRELPAMAISGSTYSENPAHRMLIINGAVLNEGAQVAPGLVLEQIRQGSAVLQFRGQRFSMTY